MTSNTDESVVEITTIKITINDLPDIGTEETVLFFEPLVIDLLESLEMIFNAAVVR
jgi:hypothetical protein